ncbi:MAG: arylsulfatase [Nocardioidaceae bacterium]
MSDSTDGAKEDARGYERFGGVAAELSSQSRPSWPPEFHARAGAPNVVVVLVDDLGYSDTGPFGSEIDTPQLDRLAADGYRLTNYHTTPVCSPARAALLTGINPHRAGFASVAHADPGYPGYVMEIPEDMPTLAESFRAGGYATFMVGKWHLTKESELHDAADKRTWPVQRGFDQYYGSMDGFTTLFHPHRLVRDNSALSIDEFHPDYYLTDDLTDQALSMIKGLRANDPAKPFFLYFAHHAVHGPLQAKATDLTKYRGRYDVGWDEVRAERFSRQLKAGLFPPGTVAAPRNQEPGSDVGAWSTLSDHERELFARYMEVYASAVDNIDQSLGRLVALLQRMGEYDNTIIVFTSDNGGTGEGGVAGTRSYFSQFVQLAGLPDGWDRDVDRDLELIGGPRAFVHYPRGWGYASNTPFRLYKGHTFAGGIRVPFVLSWPAALPRAATDTGVRHQYAYVTDLGPTLLALARVPALTHRGGSPAQPVDGASFEAFLRNPSLPASHREQYSEFAGHRAYIDGSWKLVTEHRPGAQFSDDEWELYDIGSDPTELVNLAEHRPDIVRELAKKWRAAAWHNTVFPLDDDGSLSRQRPSTELRLEEPVSLYPDTPTLERFRSSKLTKLRSFDVIIRFDHERARQGVLVAHGDQGGGYVAFVEDDALYLSYNEYGRMYRENLHGVSVGSHMVRLMFTAQEDIKWSISANLDGLAVGELGPVAQLVGMSPFTGISIGVDRGSPVDWQLFERHGCFRYDGQLHDVEYHPGPKADYNPEIILEVEQAVASLYE